MMRVLQISPTKGEFCGVALFAERLAVELATLDFDVTTVPDLNDAVDADVVLIQHHVELLDDRRVEAICSKAGCPVVLFAHSTGVEGVIEAVDGVMAMSSGIVPDTRTPVLVFPHPARTPERLSERGALRTRFGLPSEGKIIGTCGFLKFERQLVEILSALLPCASESGWFVQVITSPWYIESPGLVDEIGAVGKKYPGHFRHEHRHVTEEELNLRLQACDLLWCWTRAQSSPYASGVASDLYASGSRVVAADKMQHEHILRLPNVLWAPATLTAFLEELITQARCSGGERHDPGPVSWTRQIRTVARFLHEVGLGSGSRKSKDMSAGRVVPTAAEEQTS
jgi:hypothetical protein